MVLNVLTNYGMKMIHKGGAKAMGGDGIGFLAVFMMALLALMIKSYLVYLTFNILVERGVITMMRPVTFGEAVMMVILFSNLLN